MKNVIKLSMCRICLVEDVRMCVVTNKSLQQMYEKLTDVPFVTEDRKPMLACLFCCTRLQQCCQLQRKCVEAEQLLAHMLSEDYEQKPLTNRAQLGCVGGFIITPIENISIVDDCQTASDAVKQELAAVCEEQDVVELLPPRHREELDPDILYNSHPHVEAHRSESESEEEQLVMEIKVEEERISEKLPARETERAALMMKPTLKRKLEDTVPAKETIYVLSDLKIDKTTESSTSESVAKIEEPITTSQSSLSQSSIQDSLHSGKKPFKCNICQRSFVSKSKLNTHFRTHTGEKPYKCDVCQRSFSRKSNLKIHSRLHTGEKPYKCDVCQRSFSCVSNLNTHSRIHTGEKPYKCDVCQHSFTNKPYKCNICWCSNSKQSYLNKHNRIHTGEKPYKCDVCQRSFSFKGNLIVHFRKHSGETPFKCDVCQRSFAQASNLKLHIRVHTSERPYTCDVCQRSFSQSSNLKQHIRLHTSEKPYTCDVCQRSFGQSIHLKQHIRVHTGEKPYKCDVCQRSFSQSSNLKKHSCSYGEKPC